MYTNCNTAFSRASDSLGHFPSLPDASTPSPMHYSATATPHQHHSQLTPGECDSLSRLNSEVSCNANNNNNNYNSCSSGSTSYMGSPSSLASYETQRVSDCLMQRSVSSHSLRKSNGSHHHHFSPRFAELLDPENGPVRRVYSTGDLQRIDGMQHYHQSDSSLSSESSMIIEAMSRASPYSPEEKKVRIERYRSKRNQRNFTKKIKYACRKTLADSRPRVRGRFARNDESVMNPPVSTGEEEDEAEEDENWANLFDTLDPTNLAQEPQGSSSFGVFY